MKKIIPVIILLFVSVAPSVSHAQAPFGGMVVGTPIPCTCTSGVLLYWFAPLFLGSLPTTGDLAGLPAVRFPFYNLSHSGQWALGVYTPGLQTCWMWYGKFCAIFPTLGRITPFTGTSLGGGFSGGGGSFGGGGVTTGFGGSGTATSSGTTTSSGL